jgi:putative Holliday junction resolvase
MSGMLEAASSFRLTGLAHPPAIIPSLAPIPAMQGTLLAFDFGEKRIGVAIGECALAMAHPLTTITAAGADARLAAIAVLVDEWRPAALVVGLPVHMDGTEHAMTARARKFARRLEARFRLPVRLVDERMTTRDAASLLQESGVAARKSRPVRDQLAAQRILQNFFDREVAT